MLKILFYILVKDQEITQGEGVHLTEPFPLTTDEPMLPGPISARVAVLDFDEKGGLRPGAAFRRPEWPGQYGTYEIGPLPPAGEVLDDPRFLQLSVFGTVYKTLRMFEESDALGRQVRWAFGAPQLLVVPAAGEWANAFYERDSHSLQFFYFPGPEGKLIHTSRSQDIVAHETAHAIIDGVAPDLYDALSPQSLACHEALADITAVILAFDSRKLREKVLARTGGQIDDDSAFSGIAEQFAEALRLDKPGGYLRDPRNRKILGQPGQGGRRSDGEPVSLSEPHALSEVLSGALYEIMLWLHKSLKDEYATKKAGSATGERWQEARRKGAGQALRVATDRFKHMVLRGLDYLPPGEVSFADFGRAMLAADRASYPNSTAQQDFMQKKLIERGIVENLEDLAVRVHVDDAAVQELDLDELIASDWLAYRFADSHRELLAIPVGVPFVVRPRLKVTKKYYLTAGDVREMTECLFKVSWSVTEANAAAPDLAGKRRITVGTTLAIDWETRAIRAVVTGVPSGERASRDEFLTRLLATGVLRFGGEALTPGGQLMPAAVLGEVVDGTLRLRGTARMLHVCGLEGSF
jgi:hypothetical protein